MTSSDLRSEEELCAHEHTNVPQEAAANACAHVYTACVYRI